MWKAGIGLAIYVVCFFCTNQPLHAEVEQGRAYYDFGVFAFEDGDYDGALQNLHKALALEPENPLYQQYLGKTLMEMQRLNEALDVLSIAYAADASLGGLAFDLGMVHFKQGQYDKAADLFAAVVAQTPEHVLGRYYAGVSFFKLRRYRTALPHLLRAIALSPTIKINGSYYAGVCFFKLRQYDKARELLRLVQDTTKNDELRSSSAEWLAAIDDSKAWQVSFEAIAGYDDNVVREPEHNGDLFTDEGDFFVGGYFQGRYDLIDSRDYRFGVDFRQYNIKHQDLDEYDKAISSVQLSTAYRLDQFVFGLNYTPSFYWLDEESYGLQQEVEPVLVWEIDADLTGRLSFSYAGNNYFGSVDRVGHTDTAKANFYQTILESKGLLYGELALGRTATADPDHEYNSIKAALGMYAEIPGNFQLVIDTSYTIRDYTFRDSFYALQREDDKLYCAVALSHVFLVDWLNLGGKVEYVRNNSTIEDFEYRKLATFVSLVATF